jgi:RNA polymerase sigma-32 factor
MAKKTKAPANAKSNKSNKKTVASSPVSKSPQNIEDLTDVAEQSDVEAIIPEIIDPLSSELNEISLADGSEIDPDREILDEEIPRRVVAEIVDADALAVRTIRRARHHSDEDGDDSSDSVYADKIDDLDEDAVRSLKPRTAASSNVLASNSLTTSDPIATYLAEIRRYPLLTREQEHELAVRYRETGDPRAAEMLVTSNLRFVVKVAAEYSKFGAKLIDLVQEGNVGLMHAVKEYNPYKGTRLITYAVWWIRGYIQEYLMKQFSMVRIGTTQNQRKLFYRLQKERDALGSAGITPTNALIAGRLGVTEDEVETMSQRMSARDVSLNQPLDSENSAASLLDFRASDEPNADEMIGHLEELEVLKDNIESLRSELNPKEIYILDHRLMADEPMTLQEIGDHFGTTREAVRQLEARLMSKIRKAVLEAIEGREL